ncbi:hypothetical protein, partial [Avibacterium paragallinarum]
DEELKREIARANAVSGIASNIIQNSNTAIKAMQLFGDRTIEADAPDFLRISKAQNDKKTL